MNKEQFRKEIVNILNEGIGQHVDVSGFEYVSAVSGGASFKALHGQGYDMTTVYKSRFGDTTAFAVSSSRKPMPKFATFLLPNGKRLEDYEKRDVARTDRAINLLQRGIQYTVVIVD